MAIIDLNPPPTRTRTDFLFGTGGDDVLGRELTTAEQAALTALVDAGFDREDVLDAIFLGNVPDLPPPDNSDFDGNQRIFGRGGNDYVVDLAGDNYVSLENGNDRVLLGAGNDRIFDRGGDNRITDLGGNNTITLNAGNDVVETGDGNDNLFIRGGNNTVTDTGGRNIITLGDGNDTVTTGAGDDNINAFDGRNIIDAGDGRNVIRGGNGYDEVTVGTGNDFVEVRGADPDDTVDWDLPFIGIVFQANNYVFDAGGDDNIRATSGSRNGDDLVLSDFGGVIGDDVINLGGGENLVVDLGGDNRIRMLSRDGQGGERGGADIVFTSFTVAGDDDISTGDGADFINPGAGNDVIRGGAGLDTIVLENDGDSDRLVYRPTDRTFSAATTDVATGFDGNGVDKIDVSALDVDFSMLQTFGVGTGIGDPGLTDYLIAWNTDDTPGANFFTTILADFAIDELTEDSFVFDDALVA